MEEEKESKSEDAFEKAEKLAALLAEQNKKAEELYAKNQALLTRQIMGGKSEAGEAPVPKKEITPKEYAAAALRGVILK